jgi:hypothetical protein
MSSPKISASAGADWTQLLADPDLAGHLAELLKVYREASPEKREKALVNAMREIKGKSAKRSATDAAAEAVAGPATTTTPPDATPPFEPDIFTPSWGQDRRRYPRMKCFVAVELRLDNSAAPIWGNLSNTSIGGCFVETATPVPTGVKVEIGLWVANGKLWVKGLILNGVVTQSSPCFGVRVRFADLEPTEREVLRQFLKFVENTTKGYSSEHGYLAQMKR